MGRKKKKKIKKIKKATLPRNETFWLGVTKSKEEIFAFAERGNNEQKQNLRNAIDYRLWQIHQGEIDSDFFTKNDIDVKKLDIDIKKRPYKRRKKKEVESGVVVKPKKKQKKVIDLFDLANITKE
jgi:hypothetical protein